MLKIGLIVNPVAGIGGKVGLKGSDGEEILKRAICLGAKPESNNKAKVTLEHIKRIKDNIKIYTYPKEMGENIALEFGFDTVVLGEIEQGNTNPDDTERAAIDIAAAGVDILLFAGGDGTARNICNAVGTSLPVLGIPTGCKIHSAVYALNPRRAGDIIIRMYEGKANQYKEAEVMDIDEELFRKDRVQAKLYGYLKVPNERNLIQNMKSGRGLSEAAATEQMARYITETMEEDTLYIIGPGSTTRAIMDQLGLKNTLLGVDLVYDRKLIASDVTEEQIFSAIRTQEKVKVVVTVIGGQGYVFGRGNQQLSARIIKSVGKENIVIVASKEKMYSLIGHLLYADTGDEKTNKYLCGYYKVVVGNEDYVIFRLTY